MAAARALAAAWLAVGAQACSYVEIPFPGQDGTTSHLIARTMELGNMADMTRHFVSVVPPRNSSWSNGGFGYVATTVHVGIGPAAMSHPMDGLNTQGFSISAQTLRQSKYASKAPAGRESVSYLEVVGRLLSTCEDVDCALRFFNSVVVLGGILDSVVSGLHWAIADATGRSAVVEILDEKPVVHENPVRVMTNDPDLEWHWRNLNTFVNLSPDFPRQNDVLQIDTQSAVGAVPRTVGHGWNLWGMPGDFSPPSRFVRLFYLREYALRSGTPKSWEDAVVLGTALLNNVFLPLGTVGPDPKEGPIDQPEFTPYAVLKSPKERQLLVRGYRNSQWRLLDLKRLDFSKARSWPVEDGSLGVRDITDALTSESDSSVDLVL